MKPESPDLLKLREIESQRFDAPFDSLDNIDWNSRNSRENVAWAIMSRLMDNYEEKGEWIDGIGEFEFVIDLIAKSITDSPHYYSIIAHCLNNGVIEHDYFSEEM
jgi:hypothetical protein